MADLSRWAYLCLFCGFMLLISSTGGVLAAPATDASTGTPASIASEPTYFQQSTQNNTTQQKNPDTVNDDGDLQRVQSHLQSQLLGKLNTGVIHLDQGEYERARAVLGDEYSEEYDKYVDVVGETTGGEGGSGDGPADAFNQAQENQRELASTVDTFQETREQYQDARQAGNEERARELAREINQLATEANTTSRQLRDNYQVIGSTTGTDVSTEVRVISTITQNVTESRAEIVEREFVKTRLQITSSPAELNGSFSDPLFITGSLRTQTNESLANRPITLHFGQRSIQTTTSSTGTFALSYQPRLIRVNTSNVSAQFTPESESQYLGTDTTAEVTLRETTAEVRSKTIPGSLSYAARLNTSGVLRTTTGSVSGIPLALSVDGQRIETTTTASDGSFRFTSRLPANVPAGNQSLRITSAQSGRVISVSPTDSQVRITSTPTELEMSATQSGTRSLTVTGTLRTDSGTPVSGQSVQLRHQGEILTRTLTAPNGSYTTTVSLPPSVQSGDTVAVSARYVDPDSNLNDSRATISTTLAQIGSGGTSQTNSKTGTGSPLTTARNIVAFLGGIAILGVIAVAGRYRLRQEEKQESSPQSEAPDATPTASSTTQNGAPLVAADTHLEQGNTDLAVITAYKRLRQELAVRHSLNETHSLTHWELYQLCTDIDDVDSEAIRSVTETYEQAAYSPHAVTATDAESTLDTVRAFLQSDKDPVSDA
mgnify:CR=1 FL=1